MSKPSSWDERDYELASKIKCLPSYGLLPHDDRLISKDAVLRLLVDEAERRDREEKS